MMDTRLTIPTVIHIGCQQRSDTYTGQLAYIIYTDAKGKKRKQQSWEGWRDTNIDPVDHDNVPTSGFVLNRGVGGARQSYGWNARNEYIRVYDPRGFEFEISIRNLLFILEECTSNKGKGLEGEFVYSWNGTELILLPVASEAYRESVTFNKAQVLKVTKKDMIEGHVYQDKQLRNLVYLGRLASRVLKHHYYGSDIELLTPPTVTSHIFYDIASTDFIQQRGFTNLSCKIGDDCHPEFANMYTEFMESKYHDKVVKLVMVEIECDNISRRGGCVFVQSSGVYYGVMLTGSYYHNYRHRHSMTVSMWNSPITISELELHSSPSTWEAILGQSYTNLTDNIPRMSYDTITEHVKEPKLYTVKLQLTSGQLIGATQYVK